MAALPPTAQSGPRVGWVIDGTFPAIDPVQLGMSCAKLGCDTSIWLNKAGKIIWPRGMEAGRVWVLMRRKDVDSMGVAGEHSVTIGYNNRSQRFEGLTVSRSPQCVFFVGNNHPDSVYLVEFADRRHMLLNAFFGAPINRQYNVIAPDGPYPISGNNPSPTGRDYYSESVKDGDPYTWQQMLDDIWGYCIPSPGDPPELPFEPNGYPENFRFIGVSAWEAYNEVLRRLSCAFCLQPDATIKVVRVGETDDAKNTAVSRYSLWRVDDEATIPIIRGKVPARVVVFFNKSYWHYGKENTTIPTQMQWSSKPVYEVEAAIPPDVESAISADADPEATAYLWDEMPAVVAADYTIDNLDELQERADERAADYMRVVYTGGTRTHYTYGGFILDSEFWPGSDTSGVCWSDSGDSVIPGMGAAGPRTEVFNTADPLRVDLGNGKLVEDTVWPISDADKNPDLARKTFPNYPIHEQIVVTRRATPEANGYYDAYLVLYNPDTKQWERFEDIWVLDANDPNFPEVDGPTEQE